MRLCVSDHVTPCRFRLIHIFYSQAHRVFRITRGDFIYTSTSFFTYDSYQCIVAESICTYYSNLSGRPDIFLGSATFKKSGTLLFAESRVQKNRVIVIKKEETRLTASFSIATLLQITGRLQYDYS